MRRRGTASGKVTKARRRKPAAKTKTFGYHRLSDSNSNKIIEQLRRERDEAVEQQTATSEVLQVISSSSGELDPVFKAVLENAVRICHAKFGTLFRYNNEAFEAVAHFGAPPTLAEFNRRRGSFRPPPGGALDRMWRTKDVVCVADDAAEPVPTAAARLAGARSLIDAPMLKKNALIGAISIYRQDVQPFTDKQIELVKNFAAQAVIAIENTRLLNELRESLQQQTATSEVLKVISSSPGELKPVFEAILDNATHICEASFGTLALWEDGAFRRVALYNAPPAYMAAHQRAPLISRQSAINLYRAAEMKELVHVADAAADGHDDTIRRLGGARTLVVVPMLKDNELVGAIVIYRQEVRPFTDKQIELVKNFAAQAVIAIENTRGYNAVFRGKFGRGC